eukprot:TRINITY_DN4138_c0_g4_i1.p1 TRINITY_DN4138_c0_g4~~TRINITY_DN4138_c0_g4_i1.p1  ORF type:complete len:111 (-),score=14.91 TRINITY_DN4138_c0_g4_i1:110-442(-)
MLLCQDLITRSESFQMTEGAILRKQPNVYPCRGKVDADFLAKEGIIREFHLKFLHKAGKFFGGRGHPSGAFTEAVSRRSNCRLRRRREKGWIGRPNTRYREGNVETVKQT